MIHSAQAQNQERSLMDRLLRPDMTLQNKAQNKKFSSSRAIAEKQHMTRSFFLQRKSNEKKFAGAANFSTSQFPSRSISGKNRTEVLPQTELGNSVAKVPVSSQTQIRRVSDGQKAVPQREFAENRAFLAQGKSQKSLNRTNPPLTIDQVRELLNRNK
jgi:hypothetical protein